MICRECGKEISPKEEDVIRVTSGTTAMGPENTRFRPDRSIFFCRACYDGYTPEEILEEGEGWYAQQDSPGKAVPA